MHLVTVQYKTFLQETQVHVSFKQERKYLLIVAKEKDGEWQCVVLVNFTTLKSATVKWREGLQNLRDHRIILTKYGAVHPSAVSVQTMYLESFTRNFEYFPKVWWVLLHASMRKYILLFYIFYNRCTLSIKIFPMCLHSRLITTNCMHFAFLNWHFILNLIIM